MMICPECEYPKSAVLDSRANDGGRTLRRRRECASCGYRWTTHEAIAGSSNGGKAYSPEVMDTAERLRQRFFKLDAVARKVLVHTSIALSKAGLYDAAKVKKKEQRR